MRQSIITKQEEHNRRKANAAAKQNKPKEMLIQTQEKKTHTISPE